MFDVVYSYADWTGKGLSDLHKSSAQQEWFKLSLRSWEIIRKTKDINFILLADKSIISLCKELKLIGKFDEVREIDWNRELRQRRFVNFFAYPKMYAMLSLNNPTFICDTDMVVFPELFIDFDYTVESSIHYSYFDSSNWNGDLDRKSKVCSNLETIGGNVEWFEDCCNGGLVYWPNPKIAEKVAKDMFSFGRKMAVVSRDNGVIDNWVLYEEVLIRPLIKKHTGHCSNNFTRNWEEGAGQDGTKESIEDQLKLIKSRLEKYERE